MTTQAGEHDLVENESHEISETIEAIAKAAPAPGLMSRVAHQIFGHPPSGLLSQHHQNRNDLSTIKFFRGRLLEGTQRFNSQTNKNDFLPQLQHLESGLADLIDSATDYPVDLFLACHGAPGSDGRAALLRKYKYL